MHRNTTSVLAAGALAMTLSNAALASEHNTKNAEAKYREDVMEAMSHHFSALAAILTRKVDRPDQLGAQADLVAASAALTPTLFPAGSEGGDALPIIWEEPEKVQIAAQRAVDATAALADVIAEGGTTPEIMKAFKEAGQSCKGCHESYKNLDED